MREGIEKAGFVDDAREFFNDSLAVEFFGISDTDKREMGTAEEFLHVFEVAIGGGMIFVATIVNFDGTDGSDGAFITEDEISSFVFNKTVGFGATLPANFMAEKRTERNVGNNVKTFAKNLV